MFARRRRHVLRAAVVFGIAVLLSAVAPSVASAARIFPVCTASGSQTHPSIYGEYVVWEDQRSGVPQIYLKNLYTGVESLITGPSTANHQMPDLWMPWLVYEGTDNGTADVYALYLPTGAEYDLSDIYVAGGGYQYDPDIYGSYVVWTDTRGGTGDENIRFHNLGNGTQAWLCTAVGAQDYPHVWGNRVVWADYRAEGTGDIYGWDLNTGTPFSVKASDGVIQCFPDIWGDDVVWQDGRGGGTIYGKNLVSGLEQCLSGSITGSFRPTVYGSDVFASAGSPPYIWRFSTPPGTQTKVEARGNSYYSDAWGDKVVWEDLATQDIYGADLVAPSTSIVVSPADPNGLNGWYVGLPTVTLSGSESGDYVKGTYYLWSSGGGQQTYGAPFSVGEGDDTLSYWSLDCADNSEILTRRFKVDASAPTGSMTIAGGATWVGTTTVPATQAVTDGISGMYDMRFDGGGGWTGRVAYAAATSVVVPAGDGSRTITAEYRDNAGNPITRSGSYNLDTTPPTGTMTLDAGAAYATVATVAVDSTVTDSGCGLTQMRVHNGDGWGGWRVYAATVETTLPAGDGVKPVTVEYLDALGNTRSLADTITLDTAAPSGSFTVAGGTAWVNTTTVAVANAVTDLNSGILDMCFDAGTGWTDRVAYADATSLVLPAAEGTRVVTARFRDAAGNEAELTRTVGLDLTPPDTTDDHRAVYVGPGTVRLGATDGGSGVARTYHSVNGGPSVEGTVVTASGPGTVTVRYHSTDLAGNVETDTEIRFRVAAQVTRVAGSDRYGTAAALAALVYRSAPTTHAIIASGLDAKVVDPIAAAGLAGVYRAPVLLVNGSDPTRRIPSATSAALRAMVAGAPPGRKVVVHIVGGTASVPEWVRTRIAAMSSVVCIDRVAGADRYLTAAAIARRMREVLLARGEPAPAACLVANGENATTFFYALAASPLAADEHFPILLTKAAGMPPCTRTEATRYARSYAVGPVAAVPVAAAPAGAVRIGNASGRCAVARSIAEAATAPGTAWLSCRRTGVGNKLPDVLTGGAALGILQAPLLLTDADSLNGSTRAYLSAHYADVATCHVLGGTLSVTPYTFAGIKTALATP